MALTSELCQSTVTLNQITGLQGIVFAKYAKSTKKLSQAADWKLTSGGTLKVNSFDCQFSDPQCDNVWVSPLGSTNNICPCVRSQATVAWRVENK